MKGQRRKIETYTRFGAIATLFLCRAMSNQNCAQAGLLNRNFGRHQYEPSLHRDLDEKLREHQERRLQTTSLSTSLTLSTEDVVFGAYGVMFYVKALAQVNITSFAIYSSGATTDQIQIYTRSGIYIGHETNSSGWSLVYDNPSVNMLGRSAQTELLGMAMTISPGTFRSFFIWSPNRKLMYNPGTTEEALYSSNQYLEFYEGAGITTIFSGNYSDVFTPRVLRGEIRCVPSSTSDGSDDVLYTYSFFSSFSPTEFKV